MQHSERYRNKSCLTQARGCAGLTGSPPVQARYTCGFDTAIAIEHVEVSGDDQHISITARPSKRLAGMRAVGSTAARMEAEKKSVALPGEECPVEAMDSHKEFLTILRNTY